MKAEFWQAIDRIGRRVASRLEWESVSGLPWADLEPHLARCPGVIEEVLDPDDPRESLVVWKSQGGRVFLESTHVPAHRPSLAVSADAVTGYRLAAPKVSESLARVIGFISRPGDPEGDLVPVGFVQAPGAAVVEAILVLARSLAGVERAIADVVARHGKDQVILLLPTARLAPAPSKVRRSIEIRVLAEFIETGQEDSLASVVAASEAADGSGSTRKPKVLQVRQEDRWKDLTATLDLAEGRLELRIDSRRLGVSLLDKNRKPTLLARVFGVIVQTEPPRWTVSGLAGKEQGRLRQEFNRFKKELKTIVPLPDGEPFDYEPQRRCHFPRFEIKIRSGRSDG